MFQVFSKAQPPKVKKDPWDQGAPSYPVSVPMRTYEQAFAHASQLNHMSGDKLYIVVEVHA